MTTALAAKETTVNATEILNVGRTFIHTVPETGGHLRYAITELEAPDGEVIALSVDGEIHDPCKRCGLGYGHFSYDGDSDTCYECRGEGHGSQTTEADALRRKVNRDKAAARREAKRLAEIAKRDAELAAWVAENAELAEALVAHRTPEQDEDGYFVGQPVEYVFRPANSFLTKMADQARWEALTERQTAAAKDALDKLTARRTEQETAGHWGTVGKRDKVVVDVLAAKDFDSQWGTSWLITMKTAEGQVLKSWASGAFVSDALDAVKEGGERRITVKATVKAHGEYNGLPETTVTRVTALG